MTRHAEPDDPSPARCRYGPPYGTVLARRLATDQLTRWLRDEEHATYDVAGIAVCRCGWLAPECRVRRKLTELGLLDPARDLPPFWRAA